MTRGILRPWSLFAAFRLPSPDRPRFQFLELFCDYIAVSLCHFLHVFIALVVFAAVISNLHHILLPAGLCVTTSSAKFGLDFLQVHRVPDDILILSKQLWISEGCLNRYREHINLVDVLDFNEIDDLEGRFLPCRGRCHGQQVPTKSIRPLEPVLCGDFHGRHCAVIFDCVLKHKFQVRNCFPRCRVVVPFQTRLHFLQIHPPFNLFVIIRESELNRVKSVEAVLQCLFLQGFSQETKYLFLRTHRHTALGLPRSEQFFILLLARARLAVPWVPRRPLQSSRRLVPAACEFGGALPWQHDGLNHHEGLSNNDCIY